MRRILCFSAVTILLLGMAHPALAAALGPGQYSAPDPNISYTNITGIGYHSSGDPIYYFDSASWSVTGGDQVWVQKNVLGGGGTLCMDGSACQSFGYYDTFLVMDLPDRGTHTFTMTNGAITFISVVYDGTSPGTTASVTGTTGSGGWYRSSLVVSLAAADSPGAFPDVFVSGVASITLDGAPYVNAVTVTGEGPHTMSFYSTDNRGNAEAAQSLSLNLDSAPPTTTAALSGTQGNAGWYVSPVTVTLSATDTTSGVASVALDGSAYSSPVEYGAEGATMASFQAADIAGNTEALQSISFQIDTVTPTASITSPAAGSPMAGLVVLNGTASDETSGLAGVEVSANDSVTWNAATLSGDGWSLTLDTTALLDGPRTVQVRARDVAGNVKSTPTTITLVVDNTPPALTLTGPESFCPVCGDVATLAYSVADETSDVANWTLSADGGPPLLSNTGSVASAFDWRGSSLDPGPHTLRLTATDEAGNTSEQTSTVVIAPPAPPNASILITCPLPGDNDWCKAPATVTLSGSVAGLSIEKLNYSYEGESRTYNGSELSFEEGRPGLHEIRLNVTDSWGRISSEVAGQFKVDGVVPLISFGGATESTIALSVSDADSGIVRWTAQVFDADGKSVIWHEGDGAFSGELNWSPANSGNYFIDIFARDAAGHEAGLRRAPFTVTVSAPVAVVRQVVELFAPPVVATLTPSPTLSIPPSTVPTGISAAPVPTATPSAELAVPSPVLPAPPLTHIQITGTVFLDGNRNSVRDYRESGLAAVIVEVVAEDTVIESATTGDDGVYQLSLPKGKHYLLRIVTPTGYVLTTMSRVVADSDGITQADFGLSPSRLAAHASLFGLFGIVMVWSIASMADRRAAAVKALATALRSTYMIRASARVQTCSDS